MGEEEMKVARVQNLDPVPDTPCHGRHFLDDSYLIQQQTLSRDAINHDIHRLNYKKSLLLWLQNPNAPCDLQV